MSLLKIQQLAATLVESLYEYETLLNGAEGSVNEDERNALEKEIKRKGEYLTLIVQRLKKLIQDEQTPSRA